MNILKSSIFVAVLLGVLTSGALAQQGASEPFPLVPDGPPIPDRPQAPLVPATIADPRFPLQAQILNGRWKYNGNHEYKGAGNLQLTGQTDQDLSYHYRCVNSFKVKGDTYQARWVKPGQKLEILMSKPGSHRTETCRLDTRS